jgi:hypothetical protein
MLFSQQSADAEKRQYRDWQLTRSRKKFMDILKIFIGLMVLCVITILFSYLTRLGLLKSSVFVGVAVSLCVAVIQALMPFVPEQVDAFTTTNKEHTLKRIDGNNWQLETSNGGSIYQYASTETKDKAVYSFDLKLGQQASFGLARIQLAKDATTSVYLCTSCALNSSVPGAVRLSPVWSQFK